ncbi:MAG: hypothetical protein EOM37_07310 [Proteobacteria bacterium]|nr:lipid-binding SYLF domain-containing protein [Alphaproteobacteria bacterium]NCC03838.1 hypothetical protein [Pseudomonadota bacterium]
MRSILTRLMTVCLLAVSLLGLSACHSADDLGTQHERLISESMISFQSMMRDGQYPGLVDLATRARAILIVPNYLRAAFFVGGYGGNAVLVVRNQNNQWSNPAFYTLGGLSFGLQFGGNSSEIVIAIMTEKGLNAIMDRKVTLGGDAGVAVGELGRGVRAATGIGYKSDMYAFARSEGLYVGVSLEGSVIAPRHTWNQAFYHQPKVAPRDILVRRSVTTNSQAAASLIAAMP